MDINPADLSGIATRNQINEQGKLLQDKINNETKNIIKLNLAQDSAYWSLKHKCDDLEINYNNLQKNMRSVQLEYEKVSSQYQDELRLRAEIINKVKANREMYAVLQEHMEHLNNVNVNIKNDQKILYEAYENASNVVKNMKLEVIEAREKYTAIITNLEEKNKLLSEHNDEKKNVLAMWKKDTDSTIFELKSKIEKMEQNEKEINKFNDELTRKLNDKQAELSKKDTAVFELEKRIIILQDQNNELNEKVQIKTRDKDALENALKNKEQHFNLILDEKNTLNRKIVSSEEQLVNYEAKIQQLELENKKLQEYVIYCDQLKVEIAAKEVVTKNIANSLEIKDSEYKECVKKLNDSEALTMELRKDLEHKRAEVKANNENIEELLQKNDKLANKVSELEVRVRDLDLEFNNQQEKITNMRESTKKLENLLSDEETANMDLRQTKASADQLEKQVQELQSQLLKGPTPSEGPYSPGRNSLLSPESLRADPSRDNDTADFPVKDLIFGNRNVNLDVNKAELKRRMDAMKRGEDITKLPKAGLFKFPMRHVQSKGKAARGKDTRRQTHSQRPQPDNDPYSLYGIDSS